MSDATPTGDRTGPAVTTPPPGPAVVAPGPTATAVDPADTGRAPASRLRRSVGLWLAAVLLCSGAGAGTALVVTAMERTNVPGLQTRPDGRWDYPELSLPALPVSVPRPFTEGNRGEVHHADVRGLLLPAPRGAEPDEGLDGGFVPVDRYLGEFEEGEREALRRKLGDLGVRHVAARGWSMPDGTRTRIYLLRFTSVAYATAFKDEGLVLGAAVGARPADGPESELDGDYTAVGKVAGTLAWVYGEPEPHGEEQLRHGHVLAGDTLALILQTRKGGVPPVPFHQTVVLQNQLLG
ncbi:hypothetical protein [Streptomyces sp. C10-9-1]|uniref:hypothetical protein n=1 Tax=Streptomyces sp. C10-9-1 TaxID=1859285 RepID=UPI003F49DEFF